jgi:hypothetical protein
MLSPWISISTPALSEPIAPPVLISRSYALAAPSANTSTSAPSTGAVYSNANTTWDYERARTTATTSAAENDARREGDHRGAQNSNDGLIAVSRVGVAS